MKTTAILTLLLIMLMAVGIAQARDIYVDDDYTSAPKFRLAGYGD